MFSALTALTLALLPLVYAQDTDPATVQAALQKAKIVPNVVPNFTPRFPIEVVFTANGSTFPVTAGANLTIVGAIETVNIPTFAIFSNNSAIIGKPYLMAIVDPDAPTPANPNQSEFRHFLGADYISNASTNGEFVLSNLSKTATLTDYTPPAPPTGSAPHRYVVLCYLQNSTGVTPPSGFNASNRANFNVTSFVNSVQGNNFTLLGATYFFVSASDTTGSVKPNSSNGGPVASGTAPAASGSPSATGTSDAMKLGAVVAWTLVAVLTASGALLL